MTQDGEDHVATVPADDLDTDFHLQFFISLACAGERRLAPGLDDDLSNQPYILVLQA